VGIATTSAASVSTARLRQTAAAFDNALARTRVNSLYRPEPVYVIFTTEDGNFVAQHYENGTLVETTRLGRDDIEVTFTVGDLSEQPLPLQVEFARGKGNVIPPDLTEIRFTQGDKTQAIHITPATGNRRMGR
jgi:hypothetical protein